MEHTQGTIYDKLYEPVRMGGVKYGEIANLEELSKELAAMWEEIEKLKSTTATVINCQCDGRLHNHKLS